jgi:hypothetical protein
MKYPMLREIVETLIVMDEGLQFRFYTANILRDHKERVLRITYIEMDI